MTTTQYFIRRSPNPAACIARGFSAVGLNVYSRVSEQDALLGKAMAETDLDLDFEDDEDGFGAANRRAFDRWAAGMDMRFHPELGGWVEARAGLCAHAAFDTLDEALEALRTGDFNEVADGLMPGELYVFSGWQTGEVTEDDGVSFRPAGEFWPAPAPATTPTPEAAPAPATPTETTSEDKKMVVVCQHSGLSFEAETKQTKQHPRVARLKSRANKDGTYREVNAALDAVYDAGGYTTIDEYVALVEAHVQAAKSKAAAAHNAAAAAYRQERVENEARREAQNKALKENGYRWSKDTVISDDWALEHRSPGTYWVLNAPDGRVVTVAEALDEIARGMEVVKAERAARRAAAEAERAAAAAAAAEAKRQRDEEERAAFNQFSAVIDQHTAGLTQCERPDNWKPFADLPVVFRRQKTADNHYAGNDRVQVGEINGVRVVVVTSGSDWDTWNGYDSYYAADPAAVGLKPIDPAKLNEERFF